VTEPVTEQDTTGSAEQHTAGNTTVRTTDERREHVLHLLRNAGRVLIALFGAIVIFGAFMKLKGVDPISAYRAMWDSTITGNDSLEQILVKATPLILAALAVTVPARAGLVNVGGEGQLVLGGIGAAAAVMWFGNSMPTGVQLLVMAVFAAAAGALWAGIAAAMRLLVNVNEAVTTLLLNYVALYLMLYLIYDPWKDLHGS
jgi:simple sugar transport system permease protein